MANQTTERTNQFQHLVLLGLWVLIKLAMGRNADLSSEQFRLNAIHFGDAYGTKDAEAKEIRRQQTYGWHYK